MSSKSSSLHPAISQPFGKAKSPSTRRFRAPEAEPNITDEHFATLLNLLDSARHRKGQGNLPKREHAVLQSRLEELAALFLGFQRHLESSKTPTSKKAALKRLESAASRFMTALEGIDRSSWLSLFLRLPDPPQGIAEAVEKYACGDANADPKNLYQHFRLVTDIGKAAREAQPAILNARSTRKKYEAVRWLVTGGSPDSKLGLASLYREATGQPSAANYSANYAKSPLGKRATPFVRFVTEFIKPFAPELCTPGLGEAVNKALPRRGSRMKK